MAVYFITDSDGAFAGTQFADQFNISGDNDTVSGGAGGDDMICSGQSDQLNGDAGSDTLASAASGESLVIDGGADIDFITGHASDTLIGGDGFDWFFFEAGDLLTGVTVDFKTLAPDTVFDFSLGEIAGFELGFFGATQGADHIDTSSSYRVSVYGDAGDDDIRGRATSDDIAGGLGSDTLKGGGGSDTLYALDSAYLDDKLGLNAAVDTGLDRDVLKGGAGDDLLFAGLGSEVLDGGAGVGDVADFSLIDSVTIVADLAKGRAINGAGDHYGLRGIEELTGGGLADRLTGDSAVNVLSGGTGDDTLAGGLGGDILTGGAGHDTFLYRSAADADGDQLEDLVSGDTVDLRAIDAKTDKPGNQAFTIVDAFTGHSGELLVTYDFHDDRGAIRGDVNGDGVADFAIGTFGDPHLATFVL